MNCNCGVSNSSQGSFSPPYGGDTPKSEIFPPHSERSWEGNSSYFPPILRAPGGEIWVIFPPNGGETLGFWADFPSHLGGKQNKMLYFDSKFAFLYGEFQNFRLRRYLEFIFWLWFKIGRACGALLSPYVNSTKTNIRQLLYCIVNMILPSKWFKLGAPAMLYCRLTSIPT